VIVMPRDAVPLRERHSTREAAETEAARLSRINRGINFHVYVACGVGTRKVTP
jgi:hypothetical protein